MTACPGTAVTSVWAMVGERRVHARRSGSGPTAVVCVHGVGVSSRYMVPYVRALTGVGTVDAVDLPGFGLSRQPSARVDVPGMADGLLGWIDAVANRPVAVVGNSAGCQVAVEAAVRSPDHISRLVLIGPTVDPDAPGPARQVWRWLRNALYESPRQIPSLVRDYVDVGLPRLVANLRAVLNDRIESKLPLVTRPTLVVRGLRDRIVPQAWAEEATRLLPHGRLVVVPGAAHTVNFTHPGALADVTRHFLTEET